MRKYLYMEAKEKIMDLITNGTFSTESKIWDERTFAIKLGYTRATIKNAINALVADNILEKRRGDGTYLLENDKERALEIGDDAPNSFTQIMRIGKKNAVSYVESFKLIYQNKKIAAIFSYDYDKFYELIRTRQVDGNVIAVQKSYIPFDKFKDAHRYDFSQMSLYDYMDFKKNKPVVFKTKIEARPLRDNDLIASKIGLDLIDDGYVLYYEYKGYNEKRKLMEYTKSWYNPEFVSYKMEVER